jgi:hypothetical protein
VNPATERSQEQFLLGPHDPAFDGLQQEIERLAAVAWDGYDHARKSPRTRKAGAELSAPDYDLSVEWLATREALKAASLRQLDPTGASRVLLISGSARMTRPAPGKCPSPIDFCSWLNRCWKPTGLRWTAWI